MLKVIKEKCSGDEICTTICPVGAAQMKDGKADIDTDACMECYACMNSCPHDAIVEEE